MQGMARTSRLSAPPPLPPRPPIHPLAAVLGRFNDCDQLGKGASQGCVDGAGALLPPQVLVYTVLQAGEELVCVLVLPAWWTGSKKANT